MWFMDRPLDKHKRKRKSNFKQAVPFKKKKKKNMLITMNN